MQRWTALLIIALLGLSSPVFALSTPSPPTLKILPPSGDIGTKVNLSGNVTFSAGDTIQISFGNISSQFSESIPITPNGTFQASFFIPPVNAGPYKIFVTDSRSGLSANETFLVKTGLDTLIGTAKSNSQTLSTITGQLANLIQTVSGITPNQNLSGIMSQLATLGQSVSTEGSRLNAIEQLILSLTSSVSNLVQSSSSSSANISSQNQLLLAIVGLEGVVIVMLALCLALLVKHRGPMRRSEDIEIIDS